MSIKKIDVHTHISNDEPYIRAILDSMNMKYVTNCVWNYDADPWNNDRQIESATRFCNEYPRYYAWITTFDLTTRDEPDWAKTVIERLKVDFNNGAIGIKIHSEVGKVIKNKKGEYIQVDDPMFKPIFDFITEEKKPLLIHVGDPLEAWMPFHVPMEGRKRLFMDRNRKYSFWNKSGIPSYCEIMWARDNILENHPDMVVIGAHIATLEYRVDEVAKRLDKYPNFAIEIGGRMRYLMWQARGSVRNFFIKYQDRIMYGTDIINGNTSWAGEPRKGDYVDVDFKKARLRHGLFFRYLATDDDIPWGDFVIGDIPQPEPAYTVKGLALPKEVLYKIFYQNPIKWFPGVEKEY